MKAISQKDLAHVCQVSYKTIERMRKKRTLRTIWISNRKPVYIPVEDIEKMDEHYRDSYRMGIKVAKKAGKNYFKDITRGFIIERKDIGKVVTLL